MRTAADAVCCKRPLVRTAHLSVVLALILAACTTPKTVREGQLEWIRPALNGTHFVTTPSNRPFRAWGFNYDRDDSGRLLEDYWAAEWETVAEDFQEMKALGANVIRIHLQLARFMEAADTPNRASLQRLAALIQLAEESGLYLDITGLGCYRKEDVPPWYDALDESERWTVQARFWKEVAQAGRNSPAIFCYDLMNEPVVGGEDSGPGWLPGEPLGGKYYLQKLTRQKRGRSDQEIARDWVQTLATAIRAVDSRHMITVGVIPWGLVFKGAKPLFYSREASGPLDFVSVHFYPKDVDEALSVLRDFQIGKPVVIEEIFPLQTSIERTEEFIQKSRSWVDGYLSFYWGKSIEENARKGDLSGALMSAWLKRFQALGPAGQPAPR